MTDLHPTISRFLAAVEDRDADVLGGCLTADMAYHFLVPHPPVTGRPDVVTTMGRVLGEWDRVRWDVTAHATAGDSVFVERVDRFWKGDREAAIECLGVFVLRDGLIAEIRDYADLGTWRQRKDAALA
ncbi:MAG: limonene,2-epoxide hydrolase [Nocardioidaceae bacterium]|jgi:limonene-1,2-epoxide hydrolase|nr:limonene,2-epoxide hydrolase [Nocardioidaceae bacterium]